MKAAIALAAIGAFVWASFTPPNGWPTVNASIDVHVADPSGPIESIVNAVRKETDETKDSLPDRQAGEKSEKPEESEEVVVVPDETVLVDTEDDQSA